MFGKFYIVLRCFSGSFFEGMEYIDRFLKLGNIADTVFHSGMNSDLTDPSMLAKHYAHLSQAPTFLLAQVKRVSA